jgi:hypothetical protein
MIGGPPGAVIGSGAGALLEYVGQEALNRRRQRATRALEVAIIESGMTPDELLECILNDAQLLELVAAVIAAAAETGLQTKTSFRSLGVVCHDPAP